MCGSDVSKEYLKRFPAIVIKLKVIVANKRNQVSRRLLDIFELLFLINFTFAHLGFRVSVVAVLKNIS